MTGDDRRINLNPEPLKVTNTGTCRQCGRRAPWCICGAADYTQRTHNISVKGSVYDDYLHPTLGTDLALVMEPYYGWATPHGKGFAHHFRNVPHEIVLDLLADMGNVEYIHRSCGEYKMAADFRIVMDRIQKVIA